MDETLLQKIQRHLQVCRPCVSFMNSFRRTVDMLAHLPQSSLPQSVRQRILDQARKQ